MFGGACSAETCLQRAKGAIAMKDYTTAVDGLAECLALDPHHPNALSQLRELAGPQHDSIEYAQKAVAHLLHPNETRPWTAVNNTVVADDAYLLLEGKAMFRSFNSQWCAAEQPKGWLSLSQLSTRLTDFGLEHEQIDHLLLLMDTNADGKITEAEFLAGYRRFRASSQDTLDIGVGHRLKQRSHTVQTHVRDARFKRIMESQQDADAASLTYAVLKISDLPKKAIFSAAAAGSTHGSRLSKKHSRVVGHWVSSSRYLRLFLGC